MRAYTVALSAMLLCYVGMHTTPSLLWAVCGAIIAGMTYIGTVTAILVVWNRSKRQ